MSKTATEERSERNQQDIANLAKEVAALASQVQEINSKFDRWTGAVKGGAWVLGLFYAAFKVANEQGWLELL